MVIQLKFWLKHTLIRVPGGPSQYFFLPKIFLFHSKHWYMGSLSLTSKQSRSWAVLRKYMDQLWNVFLDPHTPTPTVSVISPRGKMVWQSTVCVIKIFHDLMELSFFTGRGAVCLWSRVAIFFWSPPWHVQYSEKISSLQWELLEQSLIKSWNIFMTQTVILCYSEWIFQDIYIYVQKFLYIWQRMCMYTCSSIDSEMLWTKCTSPNVWLKLVIAYSDGGTPNPQCLLVSLFLFTRHWDLLDIL